ncbi:MAG: hypothetical protein QOJ02_1850 [Acidobacteriota bacterium]|jgi:hypothetical protein|nr:hypothetical protein [Acidobacteriota bacterium]
MIQQPRGYSLTNMKNALAILALLVCACSVFGNGTDELHVSVVLTTGEHSKDSSSETTTITVERDAIVWERTFSGRRSEKSPLRKKFRLSPADKRSLLKLIRSNNLLVTDSIEIPRDGSNFRYFEISVDLTLGEKKGAINISGPRTAVKVKEEKLYQNTLTLVKELYRIMNSQNKSMRFDELILEPIR